jgi:hypothetical protein
MAYPTEKRMILVKRNCQTASVIQVQHEVSCNFVAGKLQSSTEPLWSVKGQEFLDQLSDS